MAVSEQRLVIRGPSSPDLGQERPHERVRVSADLGVRESDPLAAEHPPRDQDGQVVPIY